ncbi:MAG: hypothetical protein KatS3mg076_1567 [Candidatus Binatia bacterium]|nr:MAG: hypothetical protein KatS3mg076_1567 [Candidatus Binatia bacterium]
MAVRIVEGHVPPEGRAPSRPGLSAVCVVGLLFFLAPFSLAAGPVAGDGTGEVGPRELVRRVVENTPDRPFEARMTLSSTRGWERQLELRHKKQGEVFANYMEVTAPHDVKDTRFLFFERTEGRDEQFIYVPALRRAIRIADETRKQPFLGSDFYVSDLVAPDLAEYDYRYVGEETLDGRKLRLVEALPKSLEGQLYGKVVMAIDPADLVVLRTEFFDLEGKPLKVWRVTKLEKIEGFWTPVEQTMENLKSGTKSTLVTTDVTYDVDLPDNIFSRSYLSR